MRTRLATSFARRWPASRLRTIGAAGAIGAMPGVALAMGG